MICINILLGYTLETPSIGTKPPSHTNPAMRSLARFVCPLCLKMCGGLSPLELFQWGGKPPSHTPPAMCSLAHIACPFAYNTLVTGLFKPKPQCDSPGYLVLDFQINILKP